MEQDLDKYITENYYTNNECITNWLIIPNVIDAYPVTLDTLDTATIDTESIELESIDSIE